MRAPLILPLILTALLAACSTKGEIPPSKHIAQSGPLKVHPGLLGQPVPEELRGEASATKQEIPSAAPAIEEKPSIKMDPVGLRTQRSAYFDLNSADLKSDYAPALRAHARYLAEHPSARVRIEGHADERGTSEHNLRLGLKRATTLRTALVGNGASAKQIRIKSLGESRPKLAGHDEPSWAENRRADLIYEKEN